MKLIDSSIWIAHLFEANREASDILEVDYLLFSSILTLFEVEKKLLKSNISEEKITKALHFIKSKSILVNIDENIISEAAKLSIKNKLHTIDALIYASALFLKLPLVTADNDFRNLQNVEIINKS